jgi:hypothetical protein
LLYYNVVQVVRDLVISSAIDELSHMSEQDNAAEEIRNDGVGFAFEMGMQKIADQIQVFDALDTKVGVILGFVAVSIAEILGFLILAAAENLAPSRYFSPCLAFLFFSGLVCTLTSVLFGLIALGTRKFALGFKFCEMVRRANRPSSELRLMFLGDLRNACEFNADALDKKQRHSRVAISMAAASLVFYSIISMILFFHLMQKG